MSIDHQTLGATLLQLARQAIATHLGQTAPAPVPLVPGLDQPAATFVTLTHQGQLRGCIGSLVAHRPLLEDVRQNAVAAACRDPRFPPLTAAELAGIRVEVSLLTAPVPLDFLDETHALSQLHPGVDGVIFHAGSRRATFLPQVWEQLPQPEQFMAHLKQKAGLSADYWGADVKLERYQVQKWKEVLPC